MEIHYKTMTDSLASPQEESAVSIRPGIPMSSIPAILPLTPPLED